VTTRTALASLCSAVSLFPSTCMPRPGATSPTRSSKLQQESRAAQMKNDASWAQQHLADGFVAGNSWGDWQTREDFLKDLQNKTSKWKSGNISDVKVATFGPNTAVSHYTFTYDAELQGRHRARTVICSDTWSRIPAHGKRPRPTARWSRASSGDAAISSALRVKIGS
jgi:hypothetical protein